MKKRAASERCEAAAKKRRGEVGDGIGRGCGICSVEVRDVEELFWKSEKLLYLINLEGATPCLSHPTFWMSLTDACDTLCPTKIVQLLGGQQRRKVVYLLSLADGTCLEQREMMALSLARRLESILRKGTVIAEALQTLPSLLVTVVRSFPKLDLKTFCVRGIQCYLTTLRRAVGDVADSPCPTLSYRIAPNLVTDVVGLFASSDGSTAQVPPSEVQDLIDSLIFLSPNFSQELKAYTTSNSKNSQRNFPQILNHFILLTASFPFHIFLRLNSHLLHTFIYALKYIASLSHSQLFLNTLPLLQLQRQHLPTTANSLLHLAAFNNAFWFRIAEQDVLNCVDSAPGMEELKSHVEMVESLRIRMCDLSVGEVDWLLKEMALLCVICLEMAPSVYGWELFVKWSKDLEEEEVWRSGMSGALKMNRVCWFVREVLLQLSPQLSEKVLATAEEMFYFSLRGELIGAEEELSRADPDCATPLVHVFIKTLLRRPPIESSFASEWISYRSEILNLKLDFSFLTASQEGFVDSAAARILAKHLPIFQPSQVHHFIHDDLRTSSLLHEIASHLPVITAPPTAAPPPKVTYIADRSSARKAQLVVAAVLEGRKNEQQRSPPPTRDFVGAMLNFLADATTTSHYHYFPFIVQQLLLILEADSLCRQGTVQPLPLSLKVQLEKIGFILMHLCPTRLLRDSFLPFAQILHPQHLRELLKGWRTYLDAFDESFCVQDDHQPAKDKDSQEDNSNLEVWINQRYSTLKQVFKVLKSLPSPHIPGRGTEQHHHQPPATPNTGENSKDNGTKNDQEEKVQEECEEESEEEALYKSTIENDRDDSRDADHRPNEEQRLKLFPYDNDEPSTPFNDELNRPPIFSNCDHMLETSWEDHFGPVKVSLSVLQDLSKRILNVSKPDNYNPHDGIQVLDTAMSLLKHWRSRTVDRTNKIHRALPYWRRTRSQFTILLESICHLIDRINISTFKPHCDHTMPNTLSHESTMLPLLETSFTFIINLCQLPKSHSKEIVKGYLNFCVYPNSAWINQILAASIHIYAASTHNGWLRIRVAHFWQTWIRIVGSDKMYGRLFRSGLSRVGILQKLSGSELVPHNVAGEEELFEYASRRMKEVMTLVLKKHV